MTSVFCKVIERESPGHIIYEDEHTACFFPKDMEAYGHLLVVPKKHYMSIFDIPEDILAQVIVTVKKISLHLMDRLGATGVNILHASGEDAQQSVNHFHIHIFPRFKDDNIDACPKFPPITENKEELFAKLKITNS